LRDVIDSIDKYIDVFPNAKQLIGGLVGALAFMGSAAAVAEFLGLKEVAAQQHRIYNIFHIGSISIPNNLLVIIPWSTAVITSLVILIILARLAINAFRTKTGSVLCRYLGFEIRIV